MLCSQCLTTNQALRLLDEGAKFEAIVCIDADGQEVLKKIGYKQQSWDIEFDTRVEHYATNLDEEADIDAILGKAQGECYMLYGMG